MVVEGNHMDDLNFEKDINISSIKTHAEILEMLENIKEYEKKIQDLNIESIGIDDELIDVQDQLKFIDLESEEIDFIEIDNDKLKQFGLDKNSFIKNGKKHKKRIRFRLFNHKKEKFKDKTSIEIKNPTIFKLRLNKEGKLINLDLKESVKKEKKHSLFKKLNFKKGKKIEEKETSEKISRGSKIKGAFGKIGKLKKAIPNKRKKEEKT